MLRSLCVRCRGCGSGRYPEPTDFLRPCSSLFQKDRKERANSLETPHGVIRIRILDLGAWDCDPVDDPRRGGPLRSRPRDGRVESMNLVEELGCRRRLVLEPTEGLVDHPRGVGELGLNGKHLGREMGGETSPEDEGDRGLLAVEGERGREGEVRFRSVLLILSSVFEVTR
jgi:hypothetical protein